MKIYASNRDGPVAGKHFHFNIEIEPHESRGGVRGLITLDGQYFDEFECNDPPCYDLYTFIPDHHVGAQLVIQAVHLDGTEKRVSFRVGSPESSGSASLSL